MSTMPIKNIDASVGNYYAMVGERNKSERMKLKSPREKIYEDIVTLQISAIVAANNKHLTIALLICEGLNDSG